MKQLIALVGVALAATTALTAAPPGSDDERVSSYALREEERSQRTLTFAGSGTHRLEIDNVFGSIQVAAHDGANVELTMTKTLYAPTADRMEAAKREVTLDVTEEPDRINVFVDGPFRDCWKECPQGSSGTRARNERRWRGTEYEVRYDFVLRVPRRVGLYLRTVNHGEIRIEGTTGDFEVSNVNGGIEMLDVAGSGLARTVNKDVRVIFRQNPTAPSSFTTVNGDVVVSFQPALAADLRLETFNGGLYSDFDTSSLPSLTPVAERRDGKFVYKADRSVGVRIGQGGPEMRFKTLNGDVRILQRRK